ALTAWNPQAAELRIDGSLEKEISTNTGPTRKTPLTFSGYYRPNDTKSPLDLTATIRDLDLDLINAFLEPEILDIKGYASATMAITGTPDAPQMRADALLRDASVYVYYLNTTYYLQNRIGVYPDMFTFDHMTIKDELGKSGVLTGQMLHENFSNWNFDLLVEMNEPMLAMNTGEAQNSMYFGQAYTTGSVNISGYDSNLEFDISLRSEKGTNIALPMGTGSEQEFEDFIRFRAPGDTLKKEMPLNLSGITLNLQLEITPEADFRIIFDESIGDVIYGSGQGNLQMLINNLATFSMYGDIELTGGKYDFNLKNLINKSFTLQPGGTISWFGDPFGGEMNLKAIYPIQASLYDLIQDPTYQNGQRVDVELGMNMTGKIFSPGIDFSINLPNTDQITKSRVNAVISTDQERNRQAFALLAMKRFISPPNVTSDHSSTSAIAANGTEFLSSQISSWLGQISDDFNLGFNYNPGDDISSEQVALALGTQLFNERLSLSSNFGVARNNNAASANQNATNIIGDIRIEYKITPEGNVRLVMYNESNDFRATTVQQSPYTQGVGIIYREDFDSLHDLIEGFRKMLKGEDKSSTSTR
ncbi:MAG: translocation/assembly module TamB domain-containing protein, partial [Flavobacteriales bacterium]